MTFNEKIDKFILENNIPNLKQFAIQAGIPYTTLRDFYDKQSADNSRMSTIRKLSKYMKCSMDYLAYDEVVDKNEVLLSGLDLEDEYTDNDKEFTVNLNIKIPKSKNKMFFDYLSENHVKYKVLDNKNNENIVDSDIKDVKNLINNLPESEMNDTNKKSLTDMVDYFHNIAKEEK